MKKEIFAEVMRARGARAIATLTFDDGVCATAEKLFELMEKHGLCATLMIVPTRIMAIPPYHKGYCDRDELRQLCSTGSLSIESHSYSHLYIAEEGHVDYHRENCTDENREREICGSLTWLSENFPEMNFVSFGVPGGNYDLKSREIVAKTFYSSRNAPASIENIQTLTPKDGLESGDWYRLRRLGLHEKQIDYALDYLDECLERGCWFIGASHNIVGIELGRHNYQITVETLEILLRKMAEHQKRGELWVATLGDATRYLRECEAARPRAVEDEDGITLSLNMETRTPLGLALDKSVFNIPLTVKVELPASSAAPTATQGGTLLSSRTLTEDGRSFIIFECDPWGEDVRISL